MNSTTSTPTTRSLARRIRGLAVLPAAALALTACGGGDSEGGQSEAAPSASSEAAGSAEEEGAATEESPDSSAPGAGTDESGSAGGAPEGLDPEAALDVRTFSDLEGIDQKVEGELHPAEACGYLMSATVDQEAFADPQADAQKMQDLIKVTPEPARSAMEKFAKTVESVSGRDDKKLAKALGELDQACMSAAQ